MRFNLLRDLGESESERRKEADKAKERDTIYRRAI